MQPPPPPSFRVRIAVAALAFVTFVASLLLAAWLFPHLSANNDEAVYVFQAKAIADGSLTIPAEPHQDFFRPWMSGPNEDRQILVFQPVFPATLAFFDRVFGTMRLVPGAIAAGCVVLAFTLAHDTLRKERLALLAAGAMAVSPLTFIHSAMYLEYLYAVLFELAILVLVVRSTWGHARRRLVIAGLLHGLLFFMRPFDAILLGLVVVAMVLVPRPTSLRDALRSITTVAASAIPGVLLCVAYNHHVTGHFLRFPLWAIGGDNSLGFGKRSIASGAPTIDFQFNDAWIAIRQNIRAFPHWIAGGVVAVPVGAYGVWRLRRERLLTALVAITFVFPLGYLAYWGNVLIVFGRRTIGPHYYLALLIPACIVVAAGVDALAERGRVALATCAVALLAGTAIELPDKLDRNRDEAIRSTRENDAIQQAVGDDAAVVVLPVTADGPYVLHPRGWLMNEPDLSGRVLYAADRGGENVALFDRFPERTIWRFQSAEHVDGALRPDMAELDTLPLDTRREFSVGLRNRVGSPAVIFHLRTADSSLSCVIDRSSALDRTYTVVIVADERRVTADCPGQPISASFGSGVGTLILGVAYGPNEDVGFAQIHEYRVWYRAAAPSPRLLVPAEQWRRDPAPTQRWRVTKNNPAITLAIR